MPQGLLVDVTPQTVFNPAGHKAAKKPSKNPGVLKCLPFRRAQFLYRLRQP
jgi:hypothetical protein